MGNHEIMKLVQSDRNCLSQQRTGPIQFCLAYPELLEEPWNFVMLPCWGFCASFNLETLYLGCTKLDSSIEGGVWIRNKKTESEGKSAKISPKKSVLAVFAYCCGLWNALWKFAKKKRFSASIAKPLQLTSRFGRKTNKSQRLISILVISKHQNNRLQ